MKANFAIIIIAALVASASAKLCGCYRNHDKGADFDISLSTACCQEVQGTIEVMRKDRCNVGSKEGQAAYPKCCRRGGVLEVLPSKTFGYCR